MKVRRHMHMILERGNSFLSLLCLFLVKNLIKFASVNIYK